MIGIVLVSHGNLAPEALRSIESVMGHGVPGVTAVRARMDDTLDALRERIRAAARAVDQGQGTLILTDMYGDSATNISVALASSAHIEVLSGANMPIVIKAISARHTMDLEGLAAFLVEYGRSHILRAGPGGRGGGPRFSRTP